MSWMFAACLQATQAQAADFCYTHQRRARVPDLIPHRLSLKRPVARGRRFPGGGRRQPAPHSVMLAGSTGERNVAGKLERRSRRLIRWRKGSVGRISMPRRRGSCGVGGGRGTRSRRSDVASVLTVRAFVTWCAPRVDSPPPERRRSRLALTLSEREKSFGASRLARPRPRSLDALVVRLQAHLGPASPIPGLTVSVAELIKRPVKGP
jgi:hypothetical protein